MSEKRILRTIGLLAGAVIFAGTNAQSTGIPDCYNHVDQVLWVVDDPDAAMNGYRALGFTGFQVRDRVKVELQTLGRSSRVKIISANLGGAHVNWIQTPTDRSVLFKFHEMNGDGAMSLVHRFPGEEDMRREIQRLEGLGIRKLEEMTLHLKEGEMPVVLMDTWEEGKYILGFTYGEVPQEIFASMSPENRHHLELNQYAFAILDPEPVSAFWHSLGLPEFQISRPELGDTRYYGELVDHELIQGWQRNGDIAYEWCIPVKPPIVYQDHIDLHGEGIHHLAFSVQDMDEALVDFRNRGFAVSMGGTWGEKGRPGSGRYEYIDLEGAGGLTMELLWNFKE